MGWMSLLHPSTPWRGNDRPCYAKFGLDISSFLRTDGLLLKNNEKDGYCELGGAERGKEQTSLNI